VKTIHDPHYIRLIARLRAKRIALHQDQATVAARLGYTDGWLSKVENRDTRIDVLTFMRLCHALGLRAHKLVQEAEEGLDGNAPSLYLLYGTTPPALLSGTSPFEESNHGCVSNSFGLGAPSGISSGSSAHNSLMNKLFAAVPKPSSWV